MDDGEHLSVTLDYWDDTVGAFVPCKVLRQLRAAFPDAEIDLTDHQRVRLLRELEFWSTEVPAESREPLVRSSWRLYESNGPTYRFAVPFPSGHRVDGAARRMSVTFVVPAALPPGDRAQLLTFLRSLRMGEPVLDDGRQKDA